MPVTCLAIVCVLSQVLFAQVLPKKIASPVLLNESAIDTVVSIRRGETWYSDVSALTGLLGGSFSVEQGRVMMVFGSNVTTFHLTSPFIKLSDGTIFQVTTPLEEYLGVYIGEVNSWVELLKVLSGRDLRFDDVTGAFLLTPPTQLNQLVDDHSRWALDLVVIDPGHGGKDPGAIGATGLKEKEVTLDVGIRLNKFLKSKNIKTIMTRDDDTFIELSERTSIANRASGKLFISLHCNSAKNRKAEGMETYFLAPSKTERATQVALLENEAIRFEEKQDQYRELTEESYILMTMTQATFTTESESLAGLVQESVTKKIGVRDRGVDQAGFYVLIGASMPSILFEMAFISNKEEEKKLKDKKFRQKVAEEIGAAILKFLADQSPASGR